MTPTAASSKQATCDRVILGPRCGRPSVYSYRNAPLRVHVSALRFLVTDAFALARERVVAEWPDLPKKEGRLGGGGGSENIHHELQHRGCGRFPDAARAQLKRADPSMAVHPFPPTPGCWVGDRSLGHRCAGRSVAASAASDRLVLNLSSTKCREHPPRRASRSFA